jgi:polar amino acid transport system permease protein
MHQFLQEFFSLSHMRDSASEVLDGFLVNLQLMLVAEALSLVVALGIVLCRISPGRWGRPLRWLAIVWIDTSRGIPALLIFLLLGFGLPQAHIPVLSTLPLFWIATVALVFVYSGDIAEIYRAGIQSVHPSQMAAARSLGLGYHRAMRFVIMPQAIRRVVPPLLNDFISLQKDTALASTIGVIEGVRAAQIYAGNTFNVSSLVGVSLCFLIITVPLARFVDVLMARDHRRMVAGASQ